MIIGAGISCVFHLKGLDYDNVSRQMFLDAGIPVTAISLEFMEKYAER